jgi:endoglucanase Acf2
MSTRFPARPVVILLAALAVPAAPAEEGFVRLGAGSYLTTLPPGAKEPPATVYKTDAVRGPIPTNDWWSSLAWLPYSEPMYAHPLVLRAEPEGLRVFHPASFGVSRNAILGVMPGGKSKADLVLGHAGQPRFPDARLDGFSDWFVTAAFAEGGRSMRLSFGHGSPYVYALYAGGDATVAFEAAPEVWAGGAEAAVLGVLVNGKPYGLFGPSGCAWEGIGTAALTCRLKGKPHLSVALLPAKTKEALDLFARHAHAHVTGSTVAWSYHEKTAAVTTTFKVATAAREGTETATLMALYPHQWEATADPLLEPTYPSVRGTMKLRRGTGFTTTMTFPGVLPALPGPGAADRETLRALVEAAAAKKDANLGDTYWGGKRLGWLAALIPLAEQSGADAARETLAAELRDRLERWFSAADAAGKPKAKGCFYYNRTWGTVIGYPASYGSDVELNDHHFHYGYFFRGAAEVARRDPAWAAAGRWGDMIRLLVRDAANPQRDDPELPFLRNFDPYAGHSWASGRAAFADGNNNESSSEAMNAWAGLVLLGQATGDTALRDLGIWLYTTELAGIEAYWFDVGGRHRPPGYGASVVTMVWGGKSVNETWFTNKPEEVHGINWLPIHGGSLYLGRFPDYARKNYEAMKAERGSEAWASWGDLALMYRALTDPADAIRQYEAAGDRLPMEGGNSRANLFHWIRALDALGSVDRTVTADTPLYAAFVKDGKRTRVVYNLGAAPRTVTFSDGVVVKAPAKGFGVETK